MGDWCVADHFLLGDGPVPKPRWHDEEHWAMRVGAVGPGIRLMQTTEKWSCQRLADASVMGMCAAHDYLGGAAGSLVPGWNYVLAPAGAGPTFFRPLARELGGEVSEGARAVLCLPETHLYGAALHTMKLGAIPYDPSPHARLVAAFMGAVRELKGRRSELVCGLFTREHGFVHTGLATFDLASPTAGYVAWRATGAYNALDAPWTGPRAATAALSGAPAPVTLRGHTWPFGA